MTRVVATLSEGVPWFAATAGLLVVLVVVAVAARALSQRVGPRVRILVLMVAMLLGLALFVLVLLAGIWGIAETGCAPDAYECPV